MKTMLTSLLLASALALLGLGALSGPVIGDDGAVEAAELLDGRYAEPIEQTAAIAGPARAAAAARGKRPRVLHGAGQPVALEPGANSTISLRCPKRFGVPISAGLQSSIPGIFPGVISRAPQRRAMLVAAVNAADEPGEWAATIACMKGAKEA